MLNPGFKAAYFKVLLLLKATQKAVEGHILSTCLEFDTCSVLISKRFIKQPETP